MGYEKVLDLDNAIKCYEKTYINSLRVFGENHAGTLKVKFSFAMSLYKDKQFERALNLFKELLEAYTIILGAKHGNTRIVAEMIKKINDALNGENN